MRKKFGLLLIFIALFFMMEVNALDFSNPSSIYEIASIPSSEEKISSEYEFVPKYIDGVTTMETFGANWVRVTASNLVYIFPEDLQKGTIGIIYKNVGYYKGMKIDLKITIEDWDRFIDNNSGKIIYYTNHIAHGQQGYNFIDQTWEFINSETNEPVNLSTYLTFLDIDELQGFEFSSNTSKAITSFYVPVNNSIISYKINDNNKYCIFEASNKGSNMDPDSEITVLFSNISSIRFKWGTDFKTGKVSPALVYLENDYVGGYFVYKAQKPLQSETTVPFEVIYDPNEENKLEHYLAGLHEEFKYVITHNVPGEETAFYYQKYVFQNKVDDILNVNQVLIYDIKGNEVTSLFDITIEENTVTATLKRTYLNNSDFYYNTYFFHIVVQIKDEIDLSQMNAYYNNGYYSFVNYSSINVDDLTKTSNLVTTYYLENDLNGDGICDLDCDSNVDVPNEIINPKTGSLLSYGLFFGSVTLAIILYYIYYRKQKIFDL